MISNNGRFLSLSEKFSILGKNFSNTLTFKYGLPLIIYYDYD